jgi:hypothetical protein
MAQKEDEEENDDDDELSPVTLFCVDACAGN